MTKTLKDVMPKEFMGCEYERSESRKYADIDVIAEHDMTDSSKSFVRWPGNHAFVFSWVELANGKAVAWNENPGRGWSFPTVKLSKV